MTLEGEQGPQNVRRAHGGPTRRNLGPSGLRGRRLSLLCEHLYRGLPEIGYPPHPVMQCPFCAGESTKVVDSRAADGGATIRRRRECARCARRFTTYERPTITHMVRKRNGGLEPFDAQKLRRGVEQALADRPIPTGSVDRLVEEINAVVAQRGEVVTADELGHEVLLRLRRLDEVAYLRFASVYKEFTGARDFEREVAALEDNG